MSTMRYALLFVAVAFTTVLSQPAQNDWVYAKVASAVLNAEALNSFLEIVSSGNANGAIDALTQVTQMEGGQEVINQMNQLLGKMIPQAVSNDAANIMLQALNVVNKFVHY
jgi:hypothetical protein